MSKPRFGIIGAGGITAKLHLPELANENERCEVVLVGGRKDHRLDYFCSKYDIPGRTHNYEDIIADGSIDAVVIATPHPLHVEWGVKALEAGKHVFMQKPLCGDMGEANEFVAAAERSDRIVMVLPHFSAPIYKLRELIGDGEIGRISGARARTSHGGPEVYYREVSEIFGEKEQEELWFFDSKQASVGALFDMGVYAVAHLVALLGTVKQVTGVTATFDKPTGLEDQATLILKTAEGAMATAETSWCDPGRTWLLSVHGTAGKFHVPGIDGAEVTKFVPEDYNSDHSPIIQTPIDCGPGVGAGHSHFIDCIESGEPPPLSNVYAARHVTEIMLAGLESAEKGQTVEIQSSSIPE